MASDELIGLLWAEFHRATEDYAGLRAQQRGLMFQRMFVLATLRAQRAFLVEHGMDVPPLPRTLRYAVEGNGDPR